MKKLLLTLFVVLSLALGSSVSFAQDRSTRKVYPDNWEATSQVFPGAYSEYRWSPRVFPENRQATSQLSSEARTDDRSTPKILPENRQATPQVFSAARTDDPEVLNQPRGLAENDNQGPRPNQQWVGWSGGQNSFADIYCANYETRCCDASPVTNEVRWCQWNSFNAARLGCPCE